MIQLRSGKKIWFNSAESPMLKICFEKFEDLNKIIDKPAYLELQDRFQSWRDAPQGGTPVIQCWRGDPREHFSRFFLLGSWRSLIIAKAMSNFI